MAALKEAVKGEDVDDIKAKTAGAGAGFDEARRSHVQGAAGKAAAAEAPRRPAERRSRDDNVVDAEFSEVDDNKKKGAA